MRKQRGEREERAKVPLQESHPGPSAYFKLVSTVSNLKIFKLRGRGQELDSRAPHAQERILFCCLYALRFITYSVQFKSTHTYFFKIDSHFFLVITMNLKLRGTQKNRWQYLLSHINSYSSAFRSLRCIWASQVAQ